MKSIINVNLYAKLDNSHNSFFYALVTLQFGELVLVIIKRMTPHGVNWLFCDFNKNHRI